MTEENTKKIRCAECTCEEGGVNCNWIRVGKGEDTMCCGDNNRGFDAGDIHGHSPCDGACR